jgi:hypothetical protein
VNIATQLAGVISPKGMYQLQWIRSEVMTSPETRDRHRRLMDHAHGGSAPVRDAAVEAEVADAHRPSDLDVVGGVEGEGHHAVDVAGLDPRVEDGGLRRLTGEL